MTQARQVLRRDHGCWMMHGIFALAADGAFPPGTTVLAILTGAPFPAPPREPVSSGRTGQPSQRA